MRIRFLTVAQLQVLQASKAEKHLMSDGPIPLFGSLPSAVSRQWGVDDQIIGNNGGTVDITFPISFPNEVFSCTQSNDSGMKTSGNTAEGQYIVSKTNTHFTVCNEWYRYSQHENDWLAIGD